MANSPGDNLKDLKVTLNGRPVLELASKIIITEDMNNIFPRSAIFIGRDSRYEMQEALAGQKIKIEVKPQSGPTLSIDHVVYSAKPGSHTGGKGLIGVISGVIPEYTKSIQGRIKKSWSKKNADDIIKEIHKEISGLPIEVTNGFKSTSMNGMNLMPMQVIKKAHGLSGAGSNAFYFFTHEGQGKAKCKTLKDMASQKPKAKLYYDSSASAKPESEGAQDRIYDLQYEGTTVSDAKQKQGQGQNYTPSYSKNANNDPASTGQNTPGLGMSTDSAASRVAHPVINTIEQAKEKRQIDRDQQNLNDLSAKLRILTNLRSDLHPGDVIEVESGSATYFSDNAPTNSSSGKWLIATIMHSIDPGGGPAAGHTGRSLIHCVGKIP